MMTAAQSSERAVCTENHPTGFTHLVEVTAVGGWQTGQADRRSALLAV